MEQADHARPDTSAKRSITALASAFRFLWPWVVFIAWWFGAGWVMPAEPYPCEDRALFDPCWIPWPAWKVAVSASVLFLLPIAIGMAVAVVHRFARPLAVMLAVTFACSAVPGPGGLLGLIAAPIAAAIVVSVVVRRNPRSHVMFASTLAAMGAFGLGLFIGWTNYGWADPTRVTGPGFFMAFLGILLCIAVGIAGLWDWPHERATRLRPGDR